MSDDKLTNIYNANCQSLIIHLKNVLFEERGQHVMHVLSWVGRDGVHGRRGHGHVIGHSGGGHGDGVHGDGHGHDAQTQQFGAQITNFKKRAISQV